MNKVYKIKLYPNKKQQELINKTIGCSRFIYNQMLNERINVYEKLKNDKDILYLYKYKTEKEYKQEFLFLKEVSSRALQQSRINLEIAYKNFFKKQSKFPKFKSRKKSKLSYREPQVQNQIRIQDNKIKLLKLGWVKFRFGNENIKGIIKSVTITKTKSNKYYASILTEQEQVAKQRKSNNIIGLDLGLKTFCVTSDGNFYNGIKDELYRIEKRIKFFQKKFSRQLKGSNRREKTRIKIARLYEHKTNKQNHFFRHVVNRLLCDNQVIVIENLNIKGMIRNRKLSHSIFYSSWNKFITMLKQKALEYDTLIVEADRFFSSSKLCSNCGCLKEDLKLSDRIYKCDCGLEIDRDLNASINLRNFHLKSLESNDYEHRKIVRPLELNFNFKGSFNEVFARNVA